MTDIVERKPSYSGVGFDKTGGGASLAPATLGELVAFAEVMSRADLALPKHLRGNAGACMAVSMQAFRWEMDAFAVANKTYFVNDRIAYEAQLVAAVIHTRAPIKGRPNYDYIGQGPTRQCRVTCTMKDGETREYLSPTFAQITTKNSPLWKSDPDQQLGYFSIRSWARRHAPEVILGVYTPDEAEEFRDVTPSKPATSGVAERLAGHQSAPGFSREHVVRETGEIIDAVVDEPQAPQKAAEADPAPEATDTAPEVVEAADAPAYGDDDAVSFELVVDPLEWFEGAKRYVKMAEDVATLKALNEQWAVEGWWDRLKAASPTAKLDLVERMKDRDAELAKEERA